MSKFTDESTWVDVTTHLALEGVMLPSGDIDADLIVGKYVSGRTLYELPFMQVLSTFEH